MLHRNSSQAPNTATRLSHTCSLLAHQHPLFKKIRCQIWNILFDRNCFQRESSKHLWVLDITVLFMKRQIFTIIRWVKHCLLGFWQYDFLKLCSYNALNEEPRKQTNKQKPQKKTFVPQLFVHFDTKATSRLLCQILGENNKNFFFKFPVVLVTALKVTFPL